MVKKVGARSKLREHFLLNIGRVMDSDELRTVAGGITEWARRVRELRTEEGYQIQTHNDRSDLKPGQYLLENPNHNLLLNEPYLKKRELLSWTGMVSLAKCVVRWQVNHIHTIHREKHGYI